MEMKYNDWDRPADDSVWDGKEDVPSMTGIFFVLLENIGDMYINVTFSARAASQERTFMKDGVQYFDSLGTKEEKTLIYRCDHQDSAT